MSSPPGKADKGPSSVATPVSPTSSPSSSPEGGVRLADFSPPKPYQPPESKTKKVTIANSSVASSYQLANMKKTNVAGSSSSKVDQTTTLAGGHGNRRKSAMKFDHSDSDPDGDDDDVFSPEKLPAAQDTSGLFGRLSLTETPTKGKGKMTMLSDQTTALVPKRTVSFKDEAEMVSTTAAPKLSERRSVRRGISAGSSSIVPLNLQGNSASTSGQNQVGEARPVDTPNPQEMYSPSACVFVANLPQSKDDETLEAAVTRAFKDFGYVFVKIRRDENGMPFAFCQYMTEENALRAMEEGKGRMIHGRACRTEMLKANRTFAISKHNGTDITVDEAHQIMATFGNISKCERLRQQNPEGARLPPTILVELSKSDGKLNLEAVNGRNPGYNVERFDAKKKAAAGATSDKEFLKKYDINRRSVYVSGFPLGTTEAEIAKHFSLVGEVLHVDLKPRRTANGRDYAVAFVEYARADVPDRAIDALHDSLLRGCPVKVQRKEVGRSMPKRVQSEGQLKSATTPERPTGFHALPPPFAPPPMTPGANQTTAIAPAQTISPQFAHAAGGNLAHLPMTPSTNRNPGFPAAQAVSPAHWPYQVGGPPPMIFGQYSPSGYMPQNMYNPGVYGGYGGSVPATPSGFGGGTNPYTATSGFLPGPGFPAPGFPGPGLGGPGLTGPGFAGPGTSTLHDPAGNMYFVYNSGHGNPQSPGLETPTRSGAGRGMGRGQGGPENTH